MSRRTPEIGIRLALGAQPYEVMALVMGQGLRLAGMGAVLGLTASIAMSRVLRGELFRVSPFDPMAFAVATAALLAIAALATYIPARRAARVDPTVALRYE